jgi:hypothetical protein
MDQIKHTSRRAPASKASSSHRAKTTKAVPVSTAAVDIEVKAVTATSSPAAVEPGPPDGSRDWINRRASAQATRAANARQVSGRRRFVDPTTCEREYSAAEMEFMHAMTDYKQRSGRMFPTWSEVLEVLQELGYEKPAASAAHSPAHDGALAAQTA